MANGPVIPPGHESTYDRFHFAPAYRSGDLVFVSGVIGVGEDGKVPGDAAEEFANAFAHLSEVLEAAGGSLADIVDMTSFHVGMDEIMVFMAAKDTAMGEPHPAWSAIGCSGLVIPDARVEVKATAVIPINA